MKIKMIYFFLLIQCQVFQSFSDEDLSVTSDRQAVDTDDWSTISENQVDQEDSSYETINDSSYFDSEQAPMLMN